MGNPGDVKYVTVGKEEDEVAMRTPKRQICDSRQFSLLLSLLALASSAAIFSLLYIWYWEVPHVLGRYQEELQELRLRITQQSDHIDILRKKLDTEEKLNSLREQKDREAMLWKKTHGLKLPGDKALEADVCILPVDAGPCRGLIPRYFFDNVDHVCRQFNYGGCNGNGNNFHTMEECTEKCGWKQKHSKTDICKLPHEIGPCRALIQRWYFEPDEQTCKLFGYGGCDGNENNFETKDACLTKCGGKKEHSSDQGVTVSSFMYQ